MCELLKLPKLFVRRNLFGTGRLRVTNIYVSDTSAISWKSKVHF